MADLTIDQLTAAGALSGTEEVPIWQTGATRKTTVNAIAGKTVMTFPITKNDGTFTYSIQAASGDITYQNSSNASNLFNTLIFQQTDGVGTSAIQLAANTVANDTQINIIADQTDPGYYSFIHNSQNANLGLVSGVPGSFINNQPGSIAWDVSTPAIWMRSNSASAWIEVTGPPQPYVDEGNVTGATSIATGHYTVHKLTLTGNITLTLTGPVNGYAQGQTLYLFQDGTGSRLVTWPASVKWAGGLAPTLSTAPNAIDIVVLESFNGGTSWFANLAGLNYS